jgi:hypothetical protein
MKKKPSALKREHQVLQNMKFQNFFYFCGSFCPPGFGSGSTDPIESESNSDPEPQPWLQSVVIILSDILILFLFRHLFIQGIG